MLDVSTAEDAVSGFVLMGGDVDTFRNVNVIGRVVFTFEGIVEDDT